MSEPGAVWRRWTLERSEPQRLRRGVAFAGLVWLPGAGGLLALEVGVLLQRSPAAAVSLTSLIGVVLAGWTGIGVTVLRPYVEGHRRDVVTAGPDGLHVERITREGQRALVDVAWDELRRVYFEGRPGSLRFETSRGLQIVDHAGTPAEREEIAAYVHEQLATRSARRLPVVAGWDAYLDDGGPTLRRDREGRRQEGRWCAAGAALGWLNAGVLATGHIWPLAVMAGAIAALLTRSAARLFRTTPRWTAVRGWVVRVDRPGARPAFSARAVELSDSRHDDGVVSNQLVALGPPMETLRETMFWTGPDGEPLAEAGRWLADAAGIPFRDLRRHRVLQ
jgi:hypothetical protein